MEWHSDTELLVLIRKELYTAAIGDTCDQIGLRNQFLPASLKPLGCSPVPVMAGRAMPVLEITISDEPDPRQPFGLMLDALDALQQDELYIAAGVAPGFALFGELMSIAALRRGAAGAVCDGYVRDTEKILALGFPVYCRGSYGQDQRYRGIVREYRIPVDIGGIRINPGDMIVGDADGVIVIPRTAEGEVFTKALANARQEKRARSALEQGMSAKDAFARFGIL
ncbi:MAG: RraA family protein [Nitrospiraceae bacterium]|nr:RraA family protein [Nitrospiraceae bacterium]